MENVAAGHEHSLRPEVDLFDANYARWGFQILVSCSQPARTWSIFAMLLLYFDDRQSIDGVGLGFILNSVPLSLLLRESPDDLKDVVARIERRVEVLHKIVRLSLEHLLHP